LACVRWLPVSVDSFRHHYLFCNAVAGESCADATEARLTKGGGVAAATSQ
jgi:hypothetical protein